MCKLDTCTLSLLNIKLGTWKDKPWQPLMEFLLSRHDHSQAYPNTHRQTNCNMYIQYWVGTQKPKHFFSKFPWGGEVLAVDLLCSTLHVWPACTAGMPTLPLKNIPLAHPQPQSWMNPCTQVITTSIHTICYGCMYIHPWCNDRHTHKQTCTALGCMPHITATEVFEKSISDGGKAFSWSGVHRHTDTVRERRGELLRLPPDCSNSLIEFVDEDWGDGGHLCVCCVCGVCVCVWKEGVGWVDDTQKHARAQVLLQQTIGTPNNLSL